MARSKPDELPIVINLLDQAIALDPRNNEARRWQATLLRQADGYGGHQLTDKSRKLAEQREGEVKEALSDKSQLMYEVDRLAKAQFYYHLGSAMKKAPRDFGSARAEKAD